MAWSRIAAVVRGGSEPPPCRCAAFKRWSTQCKEHRENPLDCPDVLFLRRRSGAWAIPIRDGGSSMASITFCPFCGGRLTGPGTPR